VRRSGRSSKRARRLDNRDKGVNLRSDLTEVREGSGIPPNGISFDFMEEHDLSCEVTRNNHHRIKSRVSKEDVVLQVYWGYFKMGAHGLRIE